MPNNKILTFEVPEVERQDVVVLQDISRFPFYGQEFISENLVISIGNHGESHGYYDKQKVTFGKNDVSIVLPNHICMEYDTSADYVVTLVVISPQFLDELLKTTVNRNYIRYHFEPITKLTNARCESLLRLIQSIKDVSEMRDMPHHHDMLIHLVDVLMTMINYFGSDGNNNAALNSHDYEIYNQFCDLLVKHYRESRKVQFYADKLHLTPKHFSKLIYAATGHSAFYWIEQHMIIKSQQLLRNRKDLSVQEISYHLGFEDLSHFSRYFKRVTGQSPREFRASH